MSTVSRAGEEETVSLPLASRAHTSQTRRAPGMVQQCLTAGLAACFADLITFPLDTVKVRQQVQGQVGAAGPGGGTQARSILGTVASILR